MGALATIVSVGTLKDWIAIAVGIATLAYTGQKIYYNWKSHQRKEKE